MPRIIRFLANASLVAALPGCAYLHHPENDKLAQQAKAAFSEANIGAALDAERQALLKQQALRHELVRQSQLTLRDGRLAAIINKADAAGMGSSLQTLVSKRIETLQGAAVPRTAPGCAPQFKDVQADHDDALTKADFAADALRIVLAKNNAKAVLNCRLTPTVLPLSHRAGTYLLLAQDYDNKCRAAAAQAACLKEFEGGEGGELSALAATLDSIASEQAAVEQEAAASQARYEALLAEAAAAQPTPGQAQRMADRLQEALDRIASVTSKTGTLASDPVRAHLADVGKASALEAKKAVLDAYLKALGGKQPDDPSLAQHRLYLIANLVNRASDKAAPPTAGILMQAEYYRLQLGAVRARIARGQEAVQLLERKRTHWQNELRELLAAQTYLKGAPCGPVTTSPCEHRLASALRAYATAWTLGRLPAEHIDYRLIDQNELAALDESQTALQQSDAVVKAALEQVASLHAAGLKPDQIANLWQALGLTAIAVGVK